jgi:hypothetical protein
MASENQPVPIRLGIVGSRPVTLRWQDQSFEIPPLPPEIALCFQGIGTESARVDAMAALRQLGVTQVIEAREPIVRLGARREGIGIVVPPGKRITLLGEEEEPIFVPPLPPDPPIIINVMDPTRFDLPGAGQLGHLGPTKTLELRGDMVDLDALQGEVASELAEGEALTVVLWP